MVELDKDICPKKLKKLLLLKHNILIKELTGKIKDRNYLRLAVRNTKDNDKLLVSLKEEL